MTGRDETDTSKQGGCGCRRNAHDLLLLFAAQHNGTKRVGTLYYTVIYRAKRRRRSDSKLDATAGFAIVRLLLYLQCVPALSCFEFHPPRSHNLARCVFSHFLSNVPIHSPTGHPATVVETGNTSNTSLIGFPRLRFIKIHLI